MLSQELDCTSIVGKKKPFFPSVPVHPKCCSSDAYVFCLPGTVQLPCKRNSFGFKSLLPSGSHDAVSISCVCALLWPISRLIKQFVLQIRRPWSFTWPFGVRRRLVESELPAFWRRSEDRSSVRWGEIPGLAHWPTGRGGQARYRVCVAFTILDAFTYHRLDRV